MTESTSPVTEKLKSAVSDAQDLASAQLSSLRTSSSATVTATERAIWTEQQAAAHAVSLHTFVEVDSELTERDRRNLASGLRHINTGSLMSGSVMGLYMFSASKSACGLTGFYLGTQVGMQIGTDVVSYRFGSSRPACHDAMTLVRERPHISKWKRYYEGDRDLMVDLVYPPPLDDLAVDRSSAGILLDRRRSPVSRPSVAAADTSESNADMVSTAERDSHDAEVASGIAEYYSRLSKLRESNQARKRDLKSLYTSSLASFSSLESESESASASLVQQLLAVSDKISARFLNSYTVYLSNDYRRPFW